MTAREKEMAAEIRLLRRQMAEIQDRLGISSAQRDEYEFHEAMDHLAEKGDPSMLNRYLQRVNS